MTAGDTLGLCWTNLWRRRGRTLLTASGVVVGVAALVLMVSLGVGVRLQFLKLFETEYELRTLSVNRIQAAPSSSGKKPGFFNLFQMGGRIVPLDEKDLAEMRALPDVETVMPDLSLLLGFSIRSGEGAEESNRVDFFPVAGIVPEEEERYRGLLADGRMWESPQERVCLIPSSLLEAGIFGENGRERALKSKLVFDAGVEEGSEPSEACVYTVAGILDWEELGFRGRQIFLPMERAKELRGTTKGGMFSFPPYKEGTYATALVRVADPRRVEEVKGRLQNSGYQVIGAADIIDSINLVFLIVEGFLASIGAIGLLVSLFGIANTMAMAVLERTREIGIMKAVGARGRDIRKLFLAEAAALGALGGTVGLGLGYLAGKLLDAVARGVFDVPERVSLFHVSIWLAAGSILFSILVSVLAGGLPARRAARLDPVTALRYE